MKSFSLPHPGELIAGEAHLWILPAELDFTETSQFHSSLAADEKERASRFRRTSDAQRYIVRRGLLRKLLGAYLEIGPDQVTLNYTAFGKPELPANDNPGRINFNLSHSKDWILFGFTRKCEVGVDIEWIDDELNFQELAERFFAANEVRNLQSLPPQQQREAFYCGWIRKEACLKARGEGIGHGLDRIEVSLSPDQAEIVRIDDEPDAERSWTLRHLSPAPDYIGAIAVRATAVKLRYFPRPSAWVLRD